MVVERWWRQRSREEGGDKGSIPCALRGLIVGIDSMVLHKRCRRWADNSMGILDHVVESVAVSKRMGCLSLGYEKISWV